MAVLRLKRKREEQPGPDSVVVEQKPASSKRKSIEHALEGLAVDPSPTRRKFKRVVRSSPDGSVASASKAEKHEHPASAADTASAAFSREPAQVPARELMHVDTHSHAGAIDLAWRRSALDDDAIQHRASGQPDRGGEEVYDLYVEDHALSEGEKEERSRFAVRLPAAIEDLLVGEQHEDEDERGETSDENAEDYGGNDYPEDESTSTTEGEGGVVDHEDDVSTQEGDVVPADGQGRENDDDRGDDLDVW